MARCKRLWSVNYSLGGEVQPEKLQILAGCAAMAEKKAYTFLKDQGATQVMVVDIMSEGTIDVF